MTIRANTLELEVGKQKRTKAELEDVRRQEEIAKDLKDGNREGRNNKEFHSKC